MKSYREFLSYSQSEGPSLARVLIEVVQDDISDFLIAFLIGDKVRAFQLFLDATVFHSHYDLRKINFDERGLRFSIKFERKKEEACLKVTQTRGTKNTTSSYSSDEIMEAVVRHRALFTPCQYEGKLFDMPKHPVCASKYKSKKKEIFASLRGRTEKGE